MKKRGQVQLQFNYIFIIVIGVIFLAIFLSMVGSLRKKNSISTDQDIKDYFDKILNNVEVNSNALNIFNLPDAEITLDCSGYDVDGIKANQEYSVIFSPDLIRDSVVSYSLDFNVPFTTAHFSYLTSRSIVYVTDSEQIYDLLPSKINRKLVNNFDNFKNENNYKIRFISFSSIPETLDRRNLGNIEDKDVTALIINSGETVYYEKQGQEFVESNKAFFIDTTTFLGSLFAESSEIYDCNMEKALKKLNKIANINIQRATELSSTEILDHCPYENSVELFEELSIVTKNNNPSKNTMNKIAQIRSQLKSENELLTKLSCPLIY